MRAPRAQEGSLPKLEIVIASTRPNRVGLPIATWFLERANAHGKFEVALADLKAIDLPPLDEPNHPVKRQYEHEHTKAWSARIDAADAFVFITPEYNHASPPALLNAIDYLVHEWAYKPVGFVSYGGISGGTRSVEMTKQILTGLKMMPIPESVIVPFVTKSIDTTGAFAATDAHAASAVKMLDELARWTAALMTLRG
jgi:NAD(P)H-dependent FMN reductase